MIILSPQDMTDPTATAEGVKSFSDKQEKPILASWMGGQAVQRRDRYLIGSEKFQPFDYPDDAAKIFAAMWRYSKNIQSLYEALPNREQIEVEKKAIERRRREVNEDMAQVLEEGRTLLTEYESKKILDAYKIPVVKTLIAKTEQEAVRLAQELTYPIVLKLFSQTITHKTDVGGVKLNLKDESEVLAAFQQIKETVSRLVGAESFEGVTVQRMIKLDGYELILGSSTDPQFGPILLFGAGGQLVEVFKDRALAIPPLNRKRGAPFDGKDKHL